MLLILGALQKCTLEFMFIGWNTRKINSSSD